MGNIKSNELIFIFLFTTVLFAVCKYFWNLMSELKKSNRYLEAQTKLLAELAAKNGTDINIVSDVLAQARINKIKQ